MHEAQILIFCQIAHCTKLASELCKKTAYLESRCLALVYIFPVATEYGSMEQLEVLYQVRVRELQQLVHQIEQLKEQAAQEQDQLRRQLVLVSAEKAHAVSQNAQSMKNLSK